MQKESSGNPAAVSSAGAQGLFQIMPANDASLGISNPFDPAQNIQGGLSLLSQYYQQFGNWTQALEAYNQGPGSLNTALAAGSTPVSAGYASSILASSGVSDSSDLADTGSQDSSTAGASPLDLSSLGSDPTLLYVGLAVGLIVVFSLIR
jgi:hypothetical protein